jgi:hypothetical protein
VNRDGTITNRRCILSNGIGTDDNLEMLDGRIGVATIEVIRGNRVMQFSIAAKAVLMAMRIGNVLNSGMLAISMASVHDAASIPTTRSIRRVE